MLAKALFGCAGPIQDRSSGKRSDLEERLLPTWHHLLLTNTLKNFTLEPHGEILLVFLMLLKFKPSTLYLQLP